MRLALIQPELGFGNGRENLDAVIRLVDAAQPNLGRDDLLVLPEHFDPRGSREDYEAGVRELAMRYGCNVVGGSHHEDRYDGAVNVGLAVDFRGDAVGTYEKLRPYAAERQRVAGGSRLGEMRIGGRNLLVLICADFWFSDLITRAESLPDLVLVPALSVTRKPSPLYSRSLWKHLAVARAYEYGLYVGISDWAHPSRLAMPTSGVAGFANPTTTDPDRFFVPVGASGVGVYDVDFDKLAAFREDRVARGFFWKRP